MDLRASLITHSETTKAVQPSKAALNNPTTFTKTTTMRDTPFGQKWLDSPLSQLGAVLL